MKIVSTLFLFVVIGCTWRKTIGTCVFESDFGFTLNCAFKKSGLFRVRNLGGVKGYVGLGLSIGDELGFRDSISNVESSKRRSVQTRGNINRNDVRQVPPFRPLPPGGSRPMGQQPEHQRLVVQQNASSNAIRTVAAPSLMILRNDNLRQQQRMREELKLRQQQRLQQELLAMQVLKQQRMQQQEAMRQHQNMIQQQKIQQQMLASQIQRIQKLPQSGTLVLPARPPNTMSNVPVMAINQSSKPATNPVGNLPPFIAMPSSSAQLTDRISYSPTILEEVNEVAKDEMKQLPLPNDDMMSPMNGMQIVSIESEPVHKQPVSSGLSNPNQQIQGDMQTSLKALVEASNLTLEALETAILMRQQELRRKNPAPVVITPPTTTTNAPPVKKPPHNYASPTKVMNAPREYYPVGYDKNFDDNFASRVDLPDTRFYCGDQKHFPGLYADEDLGCMVFHVCALTDDGLIMKSFLCPESTLFDQTILKCNWWFFVDCKSSKSLYDSNIPISKSYQLMKALAFFSGYKSHDNSTQQLTEEIKNQKEPAESKEETIDRN